MKYLIDRVSNRGFSQAEVGPPTSAVECVYDKEADGWYCEIETIEQLREISLKEGTELIIYFHKDESATGYILIYDDYVE